MQTNREYTKWEVADSWHEVALNYGAGDEVTKFPSKEKHFI